MSESSADKKQVIFLTGPIANSRELKKGLLRYFHTEKSTANTEELFFDAKMQKKGGVELQLLKIQELISTSVYTFIFCSSLPAELKERLSSICSVVHVKSVSLESLIDQECKNEGHLAELTFNSDAVSTELFCAMLEQVFIENSQKARKDSSRKNQAVL